MKYLSNSEYEYIINKYHDTHQPFDPFSRFIRNDAAFSSETGEDPDHIIKEILRLDGEHSELSHPERWANAFSFVLKSTRISVDPRDPFPAINMIDRPLNRTLFPLWKKEVFGDLIPEVESLRARLEEEGAVTIWPDYDHSVPNFDRLLSLGFSGILAESEAARVRLVKTPATEAFFEGIRITYLAIIDLLKRLSSLAESTAGSERMAQALCSIALGPPKSFYEALLLIYLYFIISENIEGLQVRSLSNFDRLLYPFYKNDLAQGIGEEILRHDLAAFLLQFTAIGNYWNQPVYLGGEHADGSSVINELSYVFLEVYDHMGIYNPKIQIKTSEHTPKPFILYALDMIRRGHNSIVFVSDETVRLALIGAGFSETEARECDIKGCYEYAVRESFTTGMNYMNLMKPLEYALHGGKDGVSGIHTGEDSPPLSHYDEFDKLFSEYKRRLLLLIDTTVSTVNGFENYLAYVHPQSMLSATFASSLEKGRDALFGGARGNGSGIMFGFLADAADSLAMIKKYVYDKRSLTLEELVAMLDSNFKYHPVWRNRLLRDPDKYGNNKPLPDSYAKEIADFAIRSTVGRPNADERGGRWNCGFHIARMSYVQGAKTAASANGRLLGEELSKNISASMGQNREGATAAILSATKLDATSFTSDAALDLALHPSAVGGEDGLAAMYGLLLTFLRRHGHALHINVFDASTLRKAQAEPEKYRDLQIRVCGWNVLWCNINKEEQDGFIRQAEALL